ncbi:hypothetical protein F4802DRAFT_578860 [Xylaria palmicola]|nr:hypothetical protein F4802DRAFT_578860 [Xylaria palmicola]
MSQRPNSEQLVIERLRAQLKKRDADLEIARQQIFELRSSACQPRADSYSNSVISEHCPDAHGDFVVPVSQSGSTSITRNVGGKSHNRHRVESRTSQPRNHTDEPGPHAVKRPRTMSQQTPTSQKMDRGASNLSTPVFPTSGLQTNYLEQGNYLSHDNLMTPQSFASLVQHAPTDKQRGMPVLADMASFATSAGVLIDPADWLALQEDTSTDLVNTFHPVSQQSDLDASNTDMNASVCGSMTSGPTYDNTAPMTRQNSQFDNHSAVGGVQMRNMGSQMSQYQESYCQCSQQSMEYGDPSSFLGKQPSCDDTLFAVGTSLISPEDRHYMSTEPSNGLFASSDMERSLSSTSVASAKSTASSLSARAKDTLKRQNTRAQNAPLKPKPSVDENKVEPSEEKNDGKAVITKTKYVRPRQPKVFCDLCDEHREGFRGEHELRRHKDAKHQTLVKKFICVDPKEHGLPANVQVVNPLSKCKACKAQKRYGAYYNAAAHLRRTHFKEKPSRSKNRPAAVNGVDDDKRGGKGGGDWPSMHELKNWMQEIHVQQDDQRPKEDDDADEDIDNVPSFLANAELNSNMVESSPAGYASTCIANVDYDFSNPLTINTANTDMTYMATMPISSADFTFNSSASIPLSFGAEMMACSPIDHINQLSSTVSSSATITPLTVFNDAQQHFDNMAYQYTA